MNSTSKQVAIGVTFLALWCFGTPSAWSADGVLDLDGAGDYLTVIDPNLPQGSAAFTTEMWIRPALGGGNSTFTHWGGPDSAAGASMNNAFSATSTTFRQFFWSDDVSQSYAPTNLACMHS